MPVSSSLSPLSFAAAAAGLLVAGAMLIGLYQGRHLISRQIKKAGDALFSQVGFFTVVIVVFLVISVLESGAFFNDNITHNALFGTLGYALALGFDLVSVVCMLARMGALRMRDERGARLNLLGVMVCAAVSAFANAAASLQGYNATNLNHTPWWMQQVAPYLGTIFPTMIVVLSLTTDHLLDHRGPSKHIDLDIYKAQEKRRVDMLQIKLDTEKELLTLDTQLSTLRAQRGKPGQGKSGQPHREWFFLRWMRPVIPPTQEVITDQIGQAVNALYQTLDTQNGQVQTFLITVDTRLNQFTEQADQHDEILNILREQLDSLATLTTMITARLDTLTEQMHATRVQVDTLNAPIQPVQQHLDARPRKVSSAPHQSTQEVIDHPTPGAPRESTEHRWHLRQTIKLDTFRDQQEPEIKDIESRILAAQQTLGPSASNRLIARTINCSPTTVAKWLAQQTGTGQEQKLTDATQREEAG